MVSHEALKTLTLDEGWQPKLLSLFNDMFYTCRIPESVERGITEELGRHKTDHAQFDDPQILQPVDPWTGSWSGRTTWPFTMGPSGETKRRTCSTPPAPDPSIAGLGITYVHRQARHEESL